MVSKSVEMMEQLSTMSTAIYGCCYDKMSVDIGLHLNERTFKIIL